MSAIAFRLPVRPTLTNSLISSMPFDTAPRADVVGFSVADILSESIIEDDELLADDAVEDDWGVDDGAAVAMQKEISLLL